jgi:hypothetical protein
VLKVNGKNNHSETYDSVCMSSIFLTFGSILVVGLSMERYLEIALGYKF